MADIELVIKIDEETYNRIAITPRCATFLDAFRDRDMWVKAIQNGTPLEDYCESCTYKPTESEDD